MKFSQSLVDDGFTPNGDKAIDDYASTEFFVEKLILCNFHLNKITYEDNFFGANVHKFPAVTYVNRSHNHLLDILLQHSYRAFNSRIFLQLPKWNI